MNYSKSIMQEEKACYLCGRVTCLERHHVMSGVANRPLSEKYGLWVWLCHECHTGTQGAQYNPVKNFELRADAQAAFEKLHGHEMWMQVFRRNYIYEKTREG